MQTNEQTNLTDKNLDCFAELLNRELESPGLVEYIPNGAHIFHGSYCDAALTQENLKLISKTLLGMTLGYIEEAPLVMIYEYKPGQQTVFDLSTAAQKGKVQEFIQTLQEQSRQSMAIKINELLAA
jgi:hypothetical protein